MRHITSRRICCPPDATCLSGGCIYCNDHPFKSLKEIEKWARTAGIIPHRAEGEEDALKAYLWGVANQFLNVDVKWSREIRYDKRGKITLLNDDEKGKDE